MGRAPAKLSSPEGRIDREPLQGVTSARALAPSCASVLGNASAAESVAGSLRESVAGSPDIPRRSSAAPAGSDAHASGPSGSDAHVRTLAESDARYPGESDARGMSRLLGMAPPEARLSTRCGVPWTLLHTMLWCGREDGAPGGIRTPDLLIRSQLLYPLSYGRAVHAQSERNSPFCGTAETRWTAKTITEALLVWLVPAPPS